MHGSTHCHREGLALVRSMHRTSMRRSFLFASFLIATAPAFAGPQWTQPTPDELKMISDPAAPGAPAVYLFREQTADDERHMHTLYARIKILTDAGREQ